jgi:hypothetical protein
LGLAACSGGGSGLNLTETRSSCSPNDHIRLDCSDAEIYVEAGGEIVPAYLVAEIEPVDEKEIRVRGTLVDVDVDAGTYDIRLRPWLHRAGDFGVLTVMTNDTTAFEVDDAATDYDGFEQSGCRSR